MSSPNPPDILPYEFEFLAAFGRMIITWNLAESALRRLLTGLCGAKSIADTLKAKIVTAELSSVGLSQALQTFADIILPPNHAEAINHAVKYYELIRAYRNYYAHGIAGIIPFTEGPRGFIRITTAKGTLTENKDFVSLDDLKLMIGHAYRLNFYVEAISNHLFDDKGLFSLPDKPPLPDNLQKTRLHLKELFPPREESLE